MVDVCDTFCGVETFAAALEMDQMDQMNQSALEPQKKWLNMLGVAGPSYIVFDPGEWFRFIGCRYGQPRIWYQPSKMGIGNWKPPYIPIWCLHRHPVQARPQYLISPYLSQNLAPQPSVIPTPCWDSQKMDQQWPLNQCDQCDPSHNHQRSFESFVQNKSKPHVTINASRK